MLDPNKDHKGKEFVKELNDMQDASNLFRQGTDKRLENLKANGFHIGDIRHSYRDDLGDKYLLCNGDYIHSWDGYSKIIETMQTNGQPWYEVIDSGNIILTYKNNIYAIELDNYSDESYITSDIYIYTYTDYISFVQRDYSNKCLIYTRQVLNNGSASGIQGICNICLFNKRIYLEFIYTNFYVCHNVIAVKIDSLSSSQSRATFIDNLAWTASSYDYSTMTATDNYLAYVYYDGSATITCCCTTDGTNFISSGISCYENSSLSGFTTTIQNGYWIVQYVVSNTVYTHCNKIDTMGNWVTNTFKPYSNIVSVSNVAYFNGYYWMCIGTYSGYFIYKTAAIQSNSWISVSLSESPINTGSLIMDVRQSKLFFKNMIYNGTSFVVMDSQSIKKYGFTENGAKYLQYWETDDMYIEGNTIIPKTFTISTLPTISPDVGYAYIKAKE